MVVGGGLVAVPGPGPGWLIILLGLVMIAGESLSFARFADRAEIKLKDWQGGLQLFGRRLLPQRKS
jgi:hypothetical protein